MFYTRMNYEMQNEDKERLRDEEMEFIRVAGVGYYGIGRKS